MDFEEYQKESRKTAIYPNKYMMIYPALGLAGESGEVCEKIKKWIRGDYIPDYTESLKMEIGDVLWYIANLASDLNLSLEDIAKKNIEKLQDRLNRNVLKGEGDNRWAKHGKNIEREWKNLRKKGRN